MQEKDTNLQDRLDIFPSLRLARNTLVDMEKDLPIQLGIHIPGNIYLHYPYGRSTVSTCSHRSYKNILQNEHFLSAKLTWNSFV